jgi:hypothetical protein
MNLSSKFDGHKHAVRSKDAGAKYHLHKLGKRRGMGWVGFRTDRQKKCFGED